MFSDGNRGRTLTIRVIDQELGDEELIKDAPLQVIVFDPVSKGNDLVIETGKDEVFYAHSVDAPVEVWAGQDENGIVRALSITSGAGTQTILSFSD